MRAVMGICLVRPWKTPFDLADVGGVGEEDGGVGGRIDGLEGHGGAAPAVDDSLDFRLSDGRPAGQRKDGDE